MRILAGIYKGKSLLSPPGQSITRPITGQVKKSLFGMLGEDLTGQRVLDLYCGTGTLGLESLSRGASACCFAEMDKRVVERLRRNIQDVRAAGCSTIWVGDVTTRLEHWLSGLAWKADLAFVDPPYADARKWDWQQITDTVFVPLSAHLADDGIVSLRVPTDVVMPETIGPLKLLRHRTYGDMALGLLGLASPQT
jgi:16S rRNA (guanine966-N2)-methyltransferase